MSGSEDWALLDDFEGRVASGEYAWLGKGEPGKKAAKALYQASYHAEA